MAALRAVVLALLVDLIFGPALIRTVFGGSSPEHTDADGAASMGRKRGALEGAGVVAAPTGLLLLCAFFVVLAVTVLCSGCTAHAVDTLLR